MELMLRKMRKSRDMTQAQLAEQIGTTLRVVSSWERDETALSLADAARIADVFECTLDELAGREWPPSGLSTEESQLVDCYRRTDESDRPTLLATASTMAFAGEAKKESHHPTPSLAREDVK